MVDEAATPTVAQTVSPRAADDIATIYEERATRWAPRTEPERIVQQVQGIDAWQLSRQAQERRVQAATAMASTREMRMDLDRRMGVLRRQHDTVVERAQQHLREGAHALSHRVPPSAVIAHRDAWFRDKVAQGLAREGIEVVGCTPNGAEAIGMAVAEQPDLLLVDSRLEMMRPAEVLAEAVRYAPRLLAGALVDSSDEIPEVLEAGARLTFLRRVGAQAVVEDLSRLVLV